ncbi:TIGR04255 family protein [Spongisporangium articulatum]|uniref:TIGR04255 family protein n=1 Tax=Spongisporangium articulatum TaxID=3362603 RepID=A0ABW8AHU4_9ACTN
MEQLPQKPLVEALLEIRWALQPSEVEGNLRDPGFPLMVGSFQERVKDLYPHYERLPAADFPDDMTPYVVKHRFRTGPNQWPVVQVGPGIVSLNFTSEYSWEIFAERAARVVADLRDAYSRHVESPLRPNNLMLRFINSIPNSADEPGMKFLAEKLHISVSLPAVFQPASSKATLTFAPDVDDAYGSSGVIGVGSGINQGQPIIGLELQVVCSDSDLMPDLDEVGNWLDSAHQSIETWFFALIDGELLDGFRKLDQEVLG